MLLGQARLLPPLLLLLLPLPLVQASLLLGPSLPSFGHAAPEATVSWI
jgi:hypothetical protein